MTMHFVFYDTETTGLSRDFDQILQFAAIRTDADLNEIDRFDIRCRCLPWVVPAPIALLVTGIRPAQLIDRELPSFYEMMCAIRGKLVAWSPAIFLGYNTIRFDEPLLQRAFWQSLHPPYLTVTNGNARLDVLPLAQAASHLAPTALAYPITPTGRTGFKLDQLAPLNGFSHEKAHDALADVEATIHVALILKERVPKLWEHAVLNAPKAQTAALLVPGEPVLVVEHFMGCPSLWWGQRLDRNGASGTSASLARLGFDWRSLSGETSDELVSLLSKSPKPLRAIALNKAPIVFTADQASNFFDLSPSELERSDSAFLSIDPEFCAHVLAAADAMAEPRSEPEHLEQMVHAGFAGRADEALMAQFHREEWLGRADLVRRFEDVRFRQLAQRLVYEAAPHLLSKDDVSRLAHAIGERLASDPGDVTLWRSLPMAKAELEEARLQPWPGPFIDQIEAFLASIGAARRRL